MISEVNISTYDNPTLEEQSKLVIRPSMDTSSLKATIDDVFETIAVGGDNALIQYTQRFDGVLLNEMVVTEADIAQASDYLSSDLKSSIDVAYDNITKFHKLQQLQVQKIETSKGVECWQESRPINKVGLYIPGGTAPLFSTVLMLSIPAQIAGCQEIVLCTPPQKDGSIPPAILYTAHKCGVTKIIKAGGSQAIAAMVLGTESVPSVYKIFGPGNQYVTAAKMKALEYGVAIDLPAGPSEVLVFADHTANPAFVASDLLSQAEHGVDSQVVLVTTDKDLIGQVQVELRSQLTQLPRQEIAQQALQHAYAVTFKTVEESFRFINYYAPEHFIISSDDADSYIELTQNAGSVFLGNMTPESAGDYASGTNHTLPTSAYARSYSGVSLDSFIKKITFQKISAEGLKNLGPSIVHMATEEQLEGHANAVKVRLKSLES